jgi:hypothetical protein
LLRPGVLGIGPRAAGSFPVGAVGPGGLVHAPSAFGGRAERRRGPCTAPPSFRYDAVRIERSQALPGCLRLTTAMSGGTFDPSTNRPRNEASSRSRPNRSGGNRLGRHFSTLSSSLKCNPSAPALGT